MADTYYLRPVDAWELVKDGDRRGEVIKASTIGIAIDAARMLLDGPAEVVIEKGGKVAGTFRVEA